MEQLWKFLSEDSVTTLIALTGLIISIVVATREYKRSKLNVKVNYAQAILAKSDPDLFLIKMLVSNRSNLPFDLLDVKLIANNTCTHCELTAFTMNVRDEGFQANHVLVSTKLPQGFLSYQSIEIFLSFENPDIASYIRQLAETRNSEELEQASSPFLARFRAQQSGSTAEAVFCLLTTRGEILCSVPAIDCRENEWLRKEAMRKSIYDNTAQFS